MEKIIVKKDTATDNNMIFLSREDRDNRLKAQPTNSVTDEPMVFGCCEGFLIIYKNELYCIGQNNYNRFSNEPEDTIYKKPHLIAKNVVHAAGTLFYTFFITNDGRVHLQRNSSSIYKGVELFDNLTDIKEVYILSRGFRLCFVDKNNKYFLYEKYKEKQSTEEGVIFEETYKEALPDSDIVEILNGKRNFLEDGQYLSKGTVNADAQKVIFEDCYEGSWQMELKKNKIVDLRISHNFFPSITKQLKRYSNIVDIAFNPCRLGESSFLLAEKNGTLHYGEISCYYGLRRVINPCEFRFD